MAKIRFDTCHYDQVSQSFLSEKVAFIVDAKDYTYPDQFFVGGDWFEGFTAQFELFVEKNVGLFIVYRPSMEQKFVYHFTGEYSMDPTVFHIRMEFIL